ncbi:MAG: hypothetical protein LBJ38_01450 [Oscillospiraceae bacterium]|jgi:hypothetical protein|nr:hypothetical protein [Oscillospiraceae bacterium]
MKNSKLACVVMSFVLAITFCCSEAQVAAKGSAAMEAEVAASKAVAFVSTLGFGTLACLWHQKKEEMLDLLGRGKREAAVDILFPGIQDLINMAGNECATPKDPEEAVLAAVHAFRCWAALFDTQLLRNLQRCKTPGVSFAPAMSGGIILTEEQAEADAKQTTWQGKMDRRTRLDTYTADFGGSAVFALLVLWVFCGIGSTTPPDPSLVMPADDAIMNGWRKLIDMALNCWDPATHEEAIEDVAAGIQAFRWWRSGFYNNICNIITQINPTYAPTYLKGRSSVLISVPGGLFGTYRVNRPDIDLPTDAIPEQQLLSIWCSLYDSSM